MAERRMFSKSIIDSDAFLDMPLSTQALYFHLSMRADDDGFVNNPRKISRMLGSSEDEFKVLFTKKFLIGFESGVIVIKHWKIHNYIRNDRYNETKYKEERASLTLDENSAYSNHEPVLTVGIPSDIPTVDTGKVRLGKVRLGKVRLEIKKEYGEFKNISLSEEEAEKLKTLYGNKFDMAIEKLSSYIKANGKKYKDFYAVLNKHNWVYKEVMKNTVVANFTPKPYGIACDKEDGYSL